MQKSITSSAYKMPMQIKQCYCHLCIEKHCSSRHNTDWAAAMNGYSKCPKTDKKKLKPLIVLYFQGFQKIVRCRWPDSNRHGFPLDFESSASANSATAADLRPANLPQAVFYNNTICLTLQVFFRSPFPGRATVQPAEL